VDLLYDSLSYDKNIFKKDNYIYKKLNRNKIENEKLMIEINKKITGYDDTIDIYTDDYICKIKYIEDTGLIYTISSKFLKNLKFAYKLKSSYNKVIEAIYNNNIHNNTIFVKDERRYNYIRNFKRLFSKIKN
jgi:hypothetical protein